MDSAEQSNDFWKKRFEDEHERRLYLESFIKTSASRAKDLWTNLAIKQEPEEGRESETLGNFSASEAPQMPSSSGATISKDAEAVILQAIRDLPRDVVSEIRSSGGLDTVTIASNETISDLRQKLEESENNNVTLQHLLDDAKEALKGRDALIQDLQTVNIEEVNECKTEMAHRDATIMNMREEREQLRKLEEARARIDSQTQQLLLGIQQPGPKRNPALLAQEGPSKRSRRPTTSDIVSRADSEPSLAPSRPTSETPIELLNESEVEEDQEARLEKLKKELAKKVPGHVFTILGKARGREFALPIEVQVEVYEQIFTKRAMPPVSVLQRGEAYSCLVSKSRKVATRWQVGDDNREFACVNCIKFFHPCMEVKEDRVIVRSWDNGYKREVRAEDVDFWIKK